MATVRFLPSAPPPPGGRVQPPGAPVAESSSHAEGATAFRGRGHS